MGIVTHSECFTYYENIARKVTYKNNDALEIQSDKPFKNFLELSYKFKTKKKVKYTRRALQDCEEKILATVSATR